MNQRLNNSNAGQPNTARDKLLDDFSSQKKVNNKDTKSTAADQTAVAATSVASSTPNDLGATTAAVVDSKFEDCPAVVDYRPVLFQSNKKIVLASVTEGLPTELQKALVTAAVPAKDNKGEDVSAEQKRFGSIEHREIGNKAFKAFIATLQVDEKQENKALLDKLRDQKLFNPSTMELTLSKQIQLMPGSIICLAGDFYGPEKEEEVISFGKTLQDKETRYLAAYKKLAEARKDDITALLSTIDKGEVAIASAIQDSKKPSLLLKPAETADNVTFIHISRYTFWPFALYYNRYRTLAEYNFDHFGLEAKEAYRAGHSIAWATAKKAKEENKLELLVEAFAQELFACHYLTDLFASGHMRTPRKALYDHISKTSSLPGKLAIAGLLAKAMHDEDGELGLMVNNDNRRRTDQMPWKSMGDDCYFDPENQTNREEVIKAVVAGLTEIYTIYQKYDVQRQKDIEYQKDLQYPDYAAFGYVPKIAGAAHPNPNPLFKKDEKDGTVVHVRKEINNPQCNQYEANWSAVDVLTKRWLFKKKEDGKTDALTDVEKTQLQKELKELDEAKSSVECRIM